MPDPGSTEIHIGAMGQMRAARIEGGRTRTPRTGARSVALDEQLYRGPAFAPYPVPDEIPRMWEMFRPAPGDA